MCILNGFSVRKELEIQAGDNKDLPASRLVRK